MPSIHLLQVLLVSQVFVLQGVAGLEFGSYFLTLLPQNKEPDDMILEGPESMPINFYLYERTSSVERTPRNVDDYVVMDRNSLDHSLNAMNHTLPTLIIIHGFLENIRAKVISDVIEATTQVRRWNVIFVDWRELAAGPWYQSAVLNVRATGIYVADFIDRIAEAIDGRSEESSNSISDKKSSEYRPSEKFLKDLHVIGFSLGAHVAGIAGLRLTKGKIGRITALDPALPMIHLLKPISERIDKTDADFVDVWHTSSWGIPEPIGHVDFYPNGGVMQPGCFDKLLQPGCNHWNAWRYLKSSVLNPEAFVSIPCRSWNAFQKGSCKKYLSSPKSKNPVCMSVDVLSRVRGKFYLRTTPEFPYFMSPALY